MGPKIAEGHPITPRPIWSVIPGLKYPIEIQIGSAIEIDSSQEHNWIHRMDIQNLQDPIKFWEPIIDTIIACSKNL